MLLTEVHDGAMYVRIYLLYIHITCHVETSFVAHSCRIFCSRFPPLSHLLHTYIFCCFWVQLVNSAGCDPLVQSARTPPWYKQLRFRSGHVEHWLHFRRDGQLIFGVMFYWFLGRAEEFLFEVWGSGVCRWMQRLGKVARKVELHIAYVCIYLASPSPWYAIELSTHFWWDFLVQVSMSMLHITDDSSQFNFVIELFLLPIL